MEERAIQWTKGQSEYVNGRTGYTMDKRTIRICKWKNGLYNGQKKKDKKTKNNLKTHYIES